MNVWKPAPEETLLARVPVTFATGAAMRVRGRRWFRDAERNDRFVCGCGKHPCTYG
jgi:hypothetical protein